MSGVWLLDVKDPSMCHRASSFMVISSAGAGRSGSWEKGKAEEWGSLPWGPARFTKKHTEGAHGTRSSGALHGETARPGGGDARAPSPEALAAHNGDRGPGIGDRAVSNASGLSQGPETGSLRSRCGPRWSALRREETALRLSPASRRFAGGPGQPGGSQKRHPNSAFGSTQPVLCSALPTLKSSPFYKNPSHTG